MCDKHRWVERARSIREESEHVMETGLLMECDACGDIKSFYMPGHVVPASDTRLEAQRFYAPPKP